MNKEQKIKINREGNEDFKDASATGSSGTNGILKFVLMCTWQLLAHRTA